ncbi:hypothetical protein R3P38DRAFT_3012834, partial [Favolaschia claudopus]
LLLFGCRRQVSRRSGLYGSPHLVSLKGGIPSRHLDSSAFIAPSRDDAVCRDFPRLLLDRIVTTHVVETVRGVLQIFQMKEMWAAPEHFNLQGWQE